MYSGVCFVVNKDEVAEREHVRIFRDCQIPAIDMRARRLMVVTLSSSRPAGAGTLSQGVRHPHSPRLPLIGSSATLTRETRMSNEINRSSTPNHHDGFRLESAYCYEGSGTIVDSGTAFPENR